MEYSLYYFDQVLWHKILRWFRSQSEYERPSTGIRICDFEHWLEENAGIREVINSDRVLQEMGEIPPPNIYAYWLVDGKKLTSFLLKHG